MVTSPLIAATNTAVISYDPAYAYEIRHIVRDALERWYGPDSGRNRDMMYYLTVYNEPMVQPAEPETWMLKAFWVVSTRWLTPPPARARR